MVGQVDDKVDLRSRLTTFFRYFYDEKFLILEKQITRRSEIDRLVERVNRETNRENRASETLVTRRQSLGVSLLSDNTSVFHPDEIKEEKV